MSLYRVSIIYKKKKKKKIQYHISILLDLLLSHQYRIRPDIICTFILMNQKMGSYGHLVGKKRKKSSSSQIWWTVIFCCWLVFVQDTRKAKLENLNDPFRYKGLGLWSQNCTWQVMCSYWSILFKIWSLLTLQVFDLPFEVWFHDSGLSWCYDWWK